MYSQLTFAPHVVSSCSIKSCSPTFAVGAPQEECKLDDLQQDCREAYLNEKLARKWREGAAWAQLDLAGLHFTPHKCTQFLVSFPFLLLGCRQLMFVSGISPI